MLGGLLASWLMAQYSSQSMDAEFSVFWHDQRPKLRDALREAGSDNEHTNDEIAASEAGDVKLV